MKEPSYVLVEYLRPLMVARLVNVHDRWVERLESYHFQPHGGDFTPLINEAQTWVARTAYLQTHLSNEQIHEVLRRMPERELQILQGRSQGQVYKELAFELNVSITRVRTLYLRGTKRCFQFLLESMIPDQIEASPSWLETDLLQDPNPGADLRLIWQVTQGILRQRLGRGSQLAFKRLQVEFSETDPEVLIAEIKDWLRTQFSDLTAQQFERTLREVK